MTQSLKKALIVLPISLLLLVGCGDDGETSSDDSATQAAGSEDGASDDATSDSEPSDDATSDSDSSDDDASGDDASSDTGSGDGDDASWGSLDESTDLCSLVSEETLAASGLTTADGGQADRAGEPACVWNSFEREISVSVDFAYTLGAIDEFSQGAEDMNGHPVQVESDDDTTCLYAFTVGDQTRVRVMVEDNDPTTSPGEPCDAGRPALDDVMETIA